MLELRKQEHSVTGGSATWKCCVGPLISSRTQQLHLYVTFLCRAGASVGIVHVLCWEKGMYNHDVRTLVYLRALSEHALGEGQCLTALRDRW